MFCVRFVHTCFDAAELDPAAIVKHSQSDAADESQCAPVNMSWNPAKGHDVQQGHGPGTVPCMLSIFETKREWILQPLQCFELRYTIGEQQKCCKTHSFETMIPELFQPAACFFLFTSLTCRFARVHATCPNACGTWFCTCVFNRGFISLAFPGNFSAQGAKAAGFVWFCSSVSIFSKVHFVADCTMIQLACFELTAHALQPSVWIWLNMWLVWWWESETTHFAWPRNLFSKLLSNFRNVLSGFCSRCVNINACAQNQGTLTSPPNPHQTHQLHKRASYEMLQNATKC